MKTKKKIIIFFILITLIGSTIIVSGSKVESFTDINNYGSGWIKGDTSVSDMTDEQFKSMLGVITEITIQNKENSQFKKLDSFPDTLDWRNFDGKDYTTSVRDQRSCGSCWAFSVIAAVESIYKIKDYNSYENIDLSEQMLVSCCDLGGCNGCEGGNLNGALQYLQTYGVVSENNFGYVAEDVTCKPCAGCERYKILDYCDITSVKAALQDGPVVTAMQIYTDFRNYKGGIYNPTTTEIDGLHTVTIVGYNDVKQCYICKNSWGEDWGEANPYDEESEGGWFRIKYGKCDIGNNVYTISIGQKKPQNETLEITNIKGGLRGKVTIKAGKDLVNWNLEINGSFAISIGNKFKSGTIPAYNTEILTFPFTVGFGKVFAKVEANNLTKIYSGFIIGPYILNLYEI